jgi:tetratricopeptide (TPR) repeat protein
MRIRRFLLLACLTLVIVLSIWAALLFKTYGLQTLLYLIRSSPAMVWTYTKPLVTPTGNGESALSNLPSLQQSVRPQVSLPPIATKHYIQTMSHMYQKLNNCGPSSVAMAASTLGVNFDQFGAADVLKGSYYDKNVAAHEMVTYLESKGLKAIYRINGTPAQIEQLVSRDIPVIVEQWLEKRGSGELVGHFRVVRGYDQKARVFTTNDSFNGPNFVIPYGQFDTWWRAFSRGYIVVYKSDQEQVVQDVLGADWDTKLNYEGAAVTAESETKSINDGYSYFNLGTAQTYLKEYSKAAEAYNKALARTFPEHFLWYQFGPLETYYRQGQYERVLSMTGELLRQAGETEEAHYYRGLVYAKQGKTAEAAAEQQKALEANPRFVPPFE